MKGLGKHSSPKGGRLLLHSIYLLPAALIPSFSWNHWSFKCWQLSQNFKASISQTKPICGHQLGISNEIWFILSLSLKHWTSNTQPCSWQDSLINPTSVRLLWALFSTTSHWPWPVESLAVRILPCQFIKNSPTLDIWLPSISDYMPYLPHLACLEQGLWGQVSKDPPSFCWFYLFCFLFVL